MYSLFRNLLKKSGKDKLAKAERHPEKPTSAERSSGPRYMSAISGVIKTIVNRELNLSFYWPTKPDQRDCR
ncbi:MAG: hypothetical protein ACLSE8_04345 [Parasutterella sp.]